MYKASGFLASEKSKHQELLNKYEARSALKAQQ
jgi:hypothetical protein